MSDIDHFKNETRLKHHVKLYRDFYIFVLATLSDRHSFESDDKLIKIILDQSIETAHSLSKMS